jgi:hypothetical protein
MDLNDVSTNDEFIQYIKEYDRAHPDFFPSGYTDEQKTLYFIKIKNIRRNVRG